MVICGIVLRPGVFVELRAERVRDSKKIGPGRRRELAELLKRRAEKWEIVEFPPSRIDRLRGRGINLNQIEALGFARVLNRLRPTRAYVDSAGAGPELFARRLRDMLRFRIDLVVEHRADERYLPVSAASIMAKVRRDARIEELKDKYGETGSGYPSDERTIRFLRGWVRDHQTLPDFARRSWKTARRIMSQYVK